MSDVAAATELADLAAADRLAEANLLLARSHRPVDTESVMGRISELAARVEGTDHLALRRVIAIAEGIGGNVDDYDALDNHFLDSVLATRRGIPISLSVLWIEVGRRAGIEMQGVGMPGHFLVRPRDGGPLLDVFDGGTELSPADCEARFRERGGSGPFGPELLATTPTPAILARMLENLRVLFRAAFASSDAAPRVDENHFGFPGVVEDMEDGEEEQLGSSEDEKEGERKGRG